MGCQTNSITREDALRELRDRIGMATDGQLCEMLRVLADYQKYDIVASYDDPSNFGPKYKKSDFSLRRLDEKDEDV